MLVITQQGIREKIPHVAVGHTEALPALDMLDQPTDCVERLIAWSVRTLVAFFLVLRACEVLVQISQLPEPEFHGTAQIALVPPRLVVP